MSGVPPRGKMPVPASGATSQRQSDQAGIGGGRGGSGGNRAAPTARSVARHVLDRVLHQKAWATLALDAEQRRANLDERDRRFAAELVYGVLRHQTRLDDALAAHAALNRTPKPVLLALRVAAYQLLYLERVPAYAAVDDAVAVAKAKGGAKLGGFVNAVLRKVANVGFAPLPSEPLARASREHSLPHWIVEQLAQAVPADEFGAAAAAFAKQPPLTVRVNLRRTTRDAMMTELAAADIEAVPHATLPTALTVTGLGDPARDPRFAAGLLTVQDAGAQRVAQLACEYGAADGNVLDACAGVGGKATHLAELRGDRGRIDAADVSATKLELLRASAVRLGLASIRPVVVDLTAVDAAVDAALDAHYQTIVLDAPCSGLGVLRRHPDAKWRLTADVLPGLCELQRNLLTALLTRLAPGGVLIYSVCSFTNCEGPAQVAWLLAQAPGLSLLHEHRTWPHHDGSDAFYLAAIKRD